MIYTGQPQKSVFSYNRFEDNAESREYKACANLECQIFPREANAL